MHVHSVESSLGSQPVARLGAGERSSSSNFSSMSYCVVTTVPVAAGAHRERVVGDQVGDEPDSQHELVVRAGRLGDRRRHDEESCRQHCRGHRGPAVRPMTSPGRPFDVWPDHACDPLIARTRVLRQHLRSPHRPRCANRYRSAPCDETAGTVTATSPCIHDAPARTSTTSRWTAPLVTSRSTAGRHRFARQGREAASRLLDDHTRGRPVPRLARLVFEQRLHRPLRHEQVRPRVAQASRAPSTPRHTDQRLAATAGDPLLHARVRDEGRGERPDVGDAEVTLAPPGTTTLRRVISIADRRGVGHADHGRRRRSRARSASSRGGCPPRRASCRRRDRPATAARSHPRADLPPRRARRRAGTAKRSPP